MTFFIDDIFIVPHSITVFQHWLSYIFLSKPKQLTISDKGLSHYCVFTHWQHFIQMPQKDTGSFFSAITWKTKNNQQQLHWLRKKDANLVYQQIGKYWCAENKHQLSQIANAAQQVLTKGYLRKASFKNLVKTVQRYLKNWPSAVEPNWLPTEALHHFSYLQKVAQLTESDLGRLQQRYIDSQIIEFLPLFNKIERHPLTGLQQRACVINEQNNLVLAGAGTGKTSTMVGRVGYLLASKQAKVHQILLLAFGKKAATEMDERIAHSLNITDISTSTFHALGLKIISQATGISPNISRLATDPEQKQLWIKDTFNSLLSCLQRQNQTIEFLQHYLFEQKNAFMFGSKGEYYTYLAEQNAISFKGETIGCFGEIAIANRLMLLGIEYLYKPKYKAVINGKTNIVCDQHNQTYQPSFYLPQHDVYIEHWQCDTQGQSPNFICAKQYQIDITFKRNLHKKHNSRLIETFSVYEHESDLQPLYLLMLEQLTLDLQSLSIKCDPLPTKLVLKQIASTTIMDALYKQLGDMLGLFKTAMQANKSVIKFTKPIADHKKMAALNIITPIYNAYQATLQQREEIDFDDMISLATKLVASGQYKSPYKHILIDEFQDISRPRAELVKALRNSVANASLFCVGDDWQAIYGFTGSDVSITMNFTAYFGDSSLSKLDQTFRFNNSISEVAEQFICKNPHQIPKTLNTLVKTTQPAVSLLSYTDLNKDSVLLNALDLCAKHNNLVSIDKAETLIKRVLILSRYGFTLPNKKLLNHLSTIYRNISISAFTFHASKGMEADVVIIDGLHHAKNGFPANKITPPFINALLPSEPIFTHAEERRLFYVALTRAKQQVYLLSSIYQPSAFITEMQHDDYPINVISPSVNNINKNDIKYCPQCSSGILLPRKTKSSLFLGCSNFPRCGYSQSN